MDSYSYTSSSSSSSYNSYNSFNNTSTHFLPQYQQEEKRIGKPPSVFRSTLHSVRKHPGKKIMKKPIAPLPPSPRKIYKVDRIAFRDVVQKLTSAPEFQPTRLQDVALAPLSLSPPHEKPPFVHGPLVVNKPAAACNSEEKQEKSFESSSFGALSPLGFSLSPSSIAWCSSILLSPTPLSSLDPSPVL